MGEPKTREGLNAAGLAALLALAAFLRVETLGGRPLWSDERFVANLLRTSSSLAELWRQTVVIDFAQHPPLFYAIAWLFAQLGDGAAWLRAPSLLAGVASVALLYGLGRLVADRATGLLAAFLMAISVYHVDLSQDARPYLLSLALTLAQYLGLLAFLSGRDRRWLFVFAGCGIASLYTYHLALLHQAVMAAACLLFLLNARREGDAASGALRPRLPALALAWASIGVAFLPGVPQLLAFLAASEREGQHVLDLSPRVALAVAGRWGTGSGVTTALYAGLAALGAVLCLRRPRTGLVLFGWAAAPVLVFAVIPFSKYFDVRFLVSALPVFFLWAAVGALAVARAVAAGADRLVLGSGRRAAAALLAVLVVWTGAAAARVYADFRRLPLRCGDFVNRPQILALAGGVCPRHLLLNSMLREQSFVVRNLHPVADVAPAILDAYAGRYQISESLVIEVRREGDGLLGRLGEKPFFDLLPETETRFAFHGIGWRVEFVRDGEGPARELVLVAPDGVRRGPRISDPE